MTSYLALKNVEKLRALQLSIQLVKKVGEIIESLPFEEKHIKNQLIRSSTSIVQCISKAEQIYLKTKFSLYSDAIGSAQETKSWLMNCKGKNLVSEGEFLALVSMIDSIIKMLNRILENLKNHHSDVVLPSLVVQNVTSLPCFQKAQYLVKELYEMENVNLGEWHSFIKAQLINAACNIASHISEAEQIYPKKKLSFLNLAFQESNVVKSNLNLLVEADLDKEKYLELKENVTEIQYLLVLEMKNVDPKIKDTL